MKNASEYVPDFVITVGGKEFRHGSTADILSLSVTDTCNSADSFTFTVRERHPEMGRFAGGAKLQWFDSGIFEEGQKVTVEISFRGAKMQSFKGVITSVRLNFPESGIPTLTVEGRSMYDRLLNQCETLSFENKTDSDIAQKIADLRDLNSVVQETPTKYPLVSSGNSTYAAFLQKRAARIGYELVVKQDTLYFEPPAYLSGKGPELTLEWGLDLKSFTPTLSTYRKVTHVKVRSAQTSVGRGKTPLEGTAEPGDERGKLGKESASQIANRINGKNEQVVDDHLAISQDEATQQAKARLEASSIEFITGRGACNGNPKLSARSVVAIKRVGKVFSGNYYVTSVTHTIDGSGYRTSFEVKRNGR
jgi:Bacteriophage probable baseplate hub protein